MDIFAALSFLYRRSTITSQPGCLWERKSLAQPNGYYAIANFPTYDTLLPNVFVFSVPLSSAASKRADKNIENSGEYSKRIRSLCEGT